MRLTPTGDLTVTIRDDRGSTVGGAQLRIDSKRTAGLPVGSFLQTADTAGQCVFVVPVGAYRVTAVGPGSATLLRARGLMRPNGYSEVDWGSLTNAGSAT